MSKRRVPVHVKHVGHCRIRDAESVYIASNDELGYRGTQEPKPDLDDPLFWKHRLLKFETIYQPIIKLESAKSAVVGYIISIYQLGREGFQFLKDYEIYLAAPKPDLSLLRYRSEAPNLESLEYWQFQVKCLQEKYSQICRQKFGWESDLTNPARQIEQNAPVQPNEYFVEDPTSASTSISSLLRQEERRRVTDRWLGTASTPACHRRRSSHSRMKTNVRSSAGSGAEGLLLLPSPLWYNAKRNRVRGSVRDLLLGLRNHCGKEGRQFVDADVYVADDIAQRRGKGSSLEAEIASGYINVPVITRDIAFWEEKEVDLGNKYRLLNGISSSSDLEGNDRSGADRSSLTPQVKGTGRGGKYQFQEVLACDNQENRPSTAPTPVRQPNNIFEGRPPRRKRKADAAFEQPETTRRTAQSRASRRLGGKPPEFPGL
uniref:Uncharacterized protein n=1 Tax=Pyricularia oryzae (strain P131) TaxID=1143193 RepID=L7IPY4_PYRO1